MRFSALQRAENFSIVVECVCVTIIYQFQCSSASRKFLNPPEVQAALAVIIVSVLFSEPKISQCIAEVFDYPTLEGFSALQRAENFSIIAVALQYQSYIIVSVLFSEPKISQSSKDDALKLLAERFQCSSASRKFLNPPCSRSPRMRAGVSVLFSEPKISQSRVSQPPGFSSDVSVLFSEPKISQSLRSRSASAATYCFSALQRAENFSIVSLYRNVNVSSTFQCSSASRKFLNLFSR